MSTDVAAPPEGARATGRLDSLLRARELGIGLVILVVFGLTTLDNHAFAHAGSIQQLLVGAALIALLGVGETMVIVTRNVDLSVGSIVGLSAYIVGDLFKHQHIPVVLGFLIGIAVGAVIGAINGLITTVARVPSLVVTLAMLYIIRGIDGLIVNGKTIDPGSIPKAFTAVGYRTVPRHPVAGHHRRGRGGRGRLRDALVPVRPATSTAIGSNPEAAALAGIPAGRRVFTAFLVSGSLAGFAGALFLAVHAQIDVTGGTGYELSVIAAVVVGGVAIFGGSGTVLGAALGALLLNTINQALVATKVSSFWNQAIAGALLLGAIAFDRWLSLRVARSLRSAEGAHRDL